MIINYETIILWGQDRPGNLTNLVFPNQDKSVPETVVYLNLNQGTDWDGALGLFLLLILFIPEKNNATNDNKNF